MECIHHTYNYDILALNWELAESIADMRIIGYDEKSGKIESPK